MNNTTFEKLQLSEFKELVKIHCVSSLGKELIDKLSPSKSLSVVKRRLSENKEAKNVLVNSNHIPLEGLFNINSIIEKVDKGMILDPMELTKVQDFLRGCKKIKNFMLDKEFYAQNLSSYALNITECDFIESEINYIIKNNKVDSNASKELKKIRRNIEVCEAKIKERLNKFITSSSNKKHIQEFIISKRGDRYVIPIKASYKNEVDGTVLDTSSKGNTVFIEPANVSKFSIELVSLKSEESIEEYKILSYLTELIFEKIAQIKLNLEIISEYDMVFAKAKYSLNNHCITPKVNSRGYTKIVNGKHPLLKGSVVPINFEIGKTYRSLIITGPNAGGKTLSLKTVGLLTLMVQCGFDICADEDTEISVFENIFVDIGDNQSIENAGMMFDKDTLEPLYKLVIGKSEDSNALFISKKMGIRDKVLKRASAYMKDKNYNLDLVKRSKIEGKNEVVEETKEIVNYQVGDKVKLLDKDDFAIVYKEVDKFNNVEVLYKNEFIKVNVKRTELYLKAQELYPQGYDINSLFTSYEDRKLEKDIQRGSKKALKKIQKQIKNNK